VALRGGTDEERGNSHDLTTDGDMTLTDHRSGHVDGLRKTLLADDSLKTAIEKLLSGQVENEVESLLLFGNKTVSHQSAEERVTFEDSLGVVLVEGKKCTGRLSEFRKRQLSAPDLTLTAKTVLSAELKLGIKSLLLKRTSRRLESFAH